MTLQLFDQPGELASVLAADLLTRVQRRPSLVLGLATGRTPMGLYRELRELSARRLVNWAQVRTFNLDEFVGHGEDGARYRALMHDELFDHLNLQTEHIHLLEGRAADLGQECDRYERAIIEAGGIDVQVLGLGVNGHIGFNEPSEALQSRTHVALLERPTRERNAWLFGDDVSRVPHRALSMGMATIFHAREVVLLATGMEKAEVVQAMLEGPITPGLPASFLQLHSNLRVMLGGAAAAGLSRR
ncbi:MAG: glucosamine-6-phosphate deaminase [Vicinamibacterales bacterium]